ncbi:hypothetical protein [Agromyces sp. Leaf222]|uniref:hypothetical protein n=1 Tax=Agromyces sp. Leaf222 TaxID=1735688 RepID=UPI0006FBC441|nr:hypothetical protein [Agromyces sp. Leaf222]KQM84307.1 hypothetical protein ASE68_14775 [Agromyces sp. Leaf222]
MALGVILVTLALGGCAALPGESANAGVSHDEAYDDIADAVRVASPEFAEVRIGEGAEGAETFLMVELDMIGDELPGAALDSAMLVLRESVPDSFDAVRVVAVSAADVELDLEEPLLQTGVDGQTMIDPGTASIPVDALRDMRILG